MPSGWPLQWRSLKETQSLSLGSQEMLRQDRGLGGSTLVRARRGELPGCGRPLPRKFLSHSPRDDEMLERDLGHNAASRGQPLPGYQSKSTVRPSKQ